MIPNRFNTFCAAADVAIPGKLFLRSMIAWRSNIFLMPLILTPTQLLSSFVDVLLIVNWCPEDVLLDSIACCSFASTGLIGGCSGGGLHTFVWARN